MPTYSIMSKLILWYLRHLPHIYFIKTHKRKNIHRSILHRKYLWSQSTALNKALEPYCCKVPLSKFYIKNRRKSVKFFCFSVCLWSSLENDLLWTWDLLLLRPPGGDHGQPAGCHNGQQKHQEWSKLCVCVCERERVCVYVTFKVDNNSVT